MYSEEKWDWKKGFGGCISARRYGKDIFILVRQIFLIGMFILLCMGGYWVYSEFLKSAPPTPTPDISTIEGQGEVTQNIDKSQKTVTQTNMPFANGLFGWANKAESHEKK